MLTDFVFEWALLPSGLSLGSVFGPLLLLLHVNGTQSKNRFRLELSADDKRIWNVVQSNDDCGNGPCGGNFAGTTLRSFAITNKNFAKKIRYLTTFDMYVLALTVSEILQFQILYL